MDLFKEQAELEARMADRGIERYKRLSQEAMQSGEAARTTSVQTVLDSALEMVVAGIEEFLAEARSGKAGRRHTAVKRLEGIDPYEASFISLRTILDGLAKSSPMVPLALSIGSGLELEARMKRVAELHPKYVKSLMSDLDGRTRNVSHRRAVLAKVLREKETEWDAWGKKDVLNTGIKLIELVVEKTGLFAVSLDRVGKTHTSVLHATERFRDWLQGLDTRFALMSPEYLPCVVPPKDWTDFLTGGYHTDALAYPPTLVKTSSKHHKKALKAADLTKVLASVNAIQRTPWAVNRRVLEVLDTLIAEGRPLAGLPPLENMPLPTRPEDIDTNEEALTNWKRQAAGTYDANRRLTGRRIGALKSHQIAKEFAEYDAIYFPHQLDFRGRVYPISQGLNPQGNDLAKGLLHFAAGDPLDTPEAVEWFHIHGANSFGVDKVNVADRVQWVEDNAEHIIRSAENPLDYQWWADADSPFCFLAWAFEFNDWLISLSSGSSFCSQVPIAMDGSCNGLQHYSAMLRDPRGGTATNLTPSDTPQDIYAEVAKVTSKHLAVIAAGRGDGTEEALHRAAMAGAWGKWGIDRKVTKRPVMVLPYGGTQRSCFDYVYEAVRDRGDWPFADESLHKATVFLGSVVWTSIGEVVVAARLAMGWIKAVASVIAKENIPIKWTTPMGFPVVQAYPSITTAQIECMMFGARLQPRLDTIHEEKIDKRRQSSGIAPNFVHSLDASALMATVLLALEAGVSKFAMIHDSYGTTAGKAGLLAKALREAFVNMYEENDVLENFLREAVPSELQDTIPSAPFVGGLDLNEVRNSRYFFI